MLFAQGLEAVACTRARNCTLCAPALLRRESIHASILQSYFCSIPLLGAASRAPLATAQTPGAFSAVGDMTTPRGEHTATLLADGTVLIAGGFALPWGESPLVWSSAELYDPRTGTFRPTDNMTTPRSGHTATLLPDGRVLIAGGSDPSSAQLGKTSAEFYDPTTQTFTATGAMTRRWAGRGTLRPCSTAAGFSSSVDLLTVGIMPSPARNCTILRKRIVNPSSKVRQTAP